MNNLIKSILNKVWLLHSSIMMKNLELKNLHKNETCFIFGNGSSLKYYDFSKLPKFDSIGCTYSLTDKRMKYVNIKYCVFSNPFTMYPIYLNPYNNKLQINYISKIFKKIINENDQITFLSSITNYYAHFFKNPDNIKYFHHHGKANLSENNLSQDLAGIFNSTAGALDILIGVARYLGYTKLILLGCDYLGLPATTGGHFYSNYYPELNKNTSEYAKSIKEISEDLDILVIFHDKKITSPYFKYTTYSELCGSNNVYQENNEIVSKEYLIMMRDAELSKQINMNKEFSTGMKNLFF